MTTSWLNRDEKEEVGVILKRCSRVTGFVVLGCIDGGERELQRCGDKGDENKKRFILFISISIFIFIFVLFDFYLKVMVNNKK